MLHKRLISFACDVGGLVKE